VALLTRLPWLASGAHRYDAFGMAEWTWELTDRGTFGFYQADLEVAPDHLPGDLWILFALGRGIHLVLPQFNFFDPFYAVVLKVIAVSADVAIALLLLALGRTLGRDQLGVLVGLGWACCPAAVIVSAVWGQWDALSMALVLGAILAALRYRLVTGSVLLTLACLVKPQLALVAPTLATFVLRTGTDRGVTPLVALKQWIHREWPTTLRAAGSALATVLVICLPFGVSLTGLFTQWSLFERLRFALDRYQATTLGAFNLWIVPLGRAEAPLDGTVAGFGLTYAEIGLVLVITSLAVAMHGAWRIPDPVLAMSWASTVAMLGSFLFTTRAHERYLFPALVLAFVLCLVRPRMWWVAASLSLTLFFSVWSSLAWEWNPGGTTLGVSRDLIVRCLSLMNLLNLCAVVVTGLRWSQVSFTVPGRTADRHRHGPGRPVSAD
jgi:hypothetical protein